MTPNELTDALKPIPGITVTFDSADIVTVDVGDEVPTLTHALSRVVGADPQLAPDGSAAVRLTIQDANDPHDGVIIYITGGDVAFPPDPAAGSELVYPGGLRHDVIGLPPGIAYTEMVRDIDAAPTDTDNYDQLTGEVLKCAAFWCGARRAGLDVDHLRPSIDALIANLQSW
ncbi:MAG: hypothetical protein U0Q22_19710 [Acidimicrobiales bacterium]